MAGKIQALFNQYQQKYPLYTREAIVELMLDDGVITFDVANKIKSGVSLFLLDNDFFKPNNNNFSMTEIMGGNFTKTKTKPKTHFNRRIEPTFQSKKQGDCWLLSDINALNLTEWGKQAIYDAIIPDEDGSGGVTIEFNGSPLEQKEIHFSAQDIQEAKDSGKYSSGDDDMVALELATEYTLKNMVKKGFGKRVDDFDKLMGWKSYLFGVVTDEKNNKQIAISNLLGIERIDIGVADVLPGEKNYVEAQEKLLKFLANKFDKTASVCTFINDINGERYKQEEIHGNHAYAIKKIDYGKEVIIIDPYHSNKEIKLTWNKFLEHVESIYTSVQNTNVKKELYKALPIDYEQKKRANSELLRKEREKNAIKYQEECRKIEEEYLKEIKEIEEQKNAKLIEQNKQRKLKISHAIKVVGQAISKNDDNIINNAGVQNIFNEDTILPILEKYPNIILWIDKLHSGWGNGRSKSNMIFYIVEPLARLANDKGIEQEAISNFRGKCYRESDALFYTDEKVIQSEVEKMVKLIKSKS